MCTPEPVVPVRQPLERDRIVEVARMLAVDRDGRHRTEIGAAVDVAIGLTVDAEPSRLLDRLVRVRVRDVVLADDDLRVDTRLVDVAEHFDDAPERDRGWPSASV